MVLATTLTVLTSVKVDYTLIAPGYNTNIDNFIVIEDGIDEKGSFSTTSVIVLYDMPILEKWFAQNIKTVSLREAPTSYTQTTTQALNYRSLMMKDDSLAKSVIIAYLEAGIAIDYQTNYYVSLVYDYLEENTLELGDKVLSINGVEMKDYVASSSVEDYQIVIERDDETFTYNLKLKDVEGIKKIGISIQSLTTIDQTNKEYTFIDTNTGGPSGGLMQSLYIFNELTEFDYTNGLNIAGTGTINLDGTVGQIGGIDQKIITSALNGIDLFFCPAGNNCEDAEEILETLHTDMILIPISSFEEAVNYLREYGEPIE